MNKPNCVDLTTYIPNFIKGGHELGLDMWAELPWEQRETARREVFYNERQTEYTYGRGKGERTYFPVKETVNDITPMGHLIHFMRQKVNAFFDGNFEACFINGYETQHEHLGWHSDDAEIIDHSKPIVVISLGAAREIWHRKISKTDPVTEFRRLLEPGSAFVMPAGFQQTHEHRIPKHDRPCGPRISLTFRALK